MNLQEELTWIFSQQTSDPLRYAFPKKRVVHPFVKGMEPVSNPHDQWQDLICSQDRSPKHIAYINIPFCQTQCLFCGFYRNNARTGLESEYIDCLIKELKEVKKNHFLERSPLQAVYIGGGTPSSLSSGNIFRLLESIHENLNLANDCELTFECRLYDFDDDKIQSCLDGGVNRFSIGVQSFNTRCRQLLGRMLPGDEIVSRLSHIQSQGQAALAIDLMYGLPEQTMEIWEKDLMRAAQYGLDGISVYQLNVFEGGRLNKKVSKGKLAEPSKTSEQAIYFKRSIDVLDQCKYRRMSNTHWQNTTRERNLYNSLSKQPDILLLPFGSGSGGKVEGFSLALETDLKRYIDITGQDRKPIAFMAKQPEISPLISEITWQLDQGYLDLELIGSRYGSKYCEKMKPVLEAWQSNGLVQSTEGLVDLTVAGLFWYVNLSQALVDWLSKPDQDDTPDVEITGVAAQDG